MKICKRCTLNLPLTSFHYNRGTSDKCATYCKECASILSKIYRDENSNRLKEYEKSRWEARRIDPVYKAKAAKQQRRWLENNRDKHRARKLKWRANNPLQVKAHIAVKDAIRAGKLRKKLSCKCGSTEQIEAHHSDYTKPLKVKWLCRKCHIKLHCELRQ